MKEMTCRQEFCFCSPDDLTPPQLLQDLHDHEPPIGGPLQDEATSIGRQMTKQ